MSTDEMIKQGVREIVELLVNGEYAKLEKMNKLGILSASEVEQAILDYRGKLTLPPIEAYDEIDIYKVDNPEKYTEEYSIDFDLWVKNLKSDLTLSCEATVDERGYVNVTLYSVHVL